MVECVKNEPFAVGELHHVFTVVAYADLVGKCELHLVIADVSPFVLGAYRNFNALCYLFYRNLF